MRYAEYRFRLPAGKAAQLSDELMAAGFHSFARSSLVEGREELQLWAAGDRLPTAAAACCNRLGLPLPAVRHHQERDLLALGQPERPFPLCDGVWVQPADDVSGIPADATRLCIPPGPAFGDGRHPSTRMAAELLPADCTGLRVYDCGCGSGVLGVLAGLRGARSVDASDIDPGSLRATRALAARHGLDVTVFASDLIAAVPADRCYDLFIANLYADLLLDVLPDPRFRQLLPTGTFVCSGIAQQRRGAVEAAIEAAGLALVDARQEAWWCALRAVSR